MIIDTFKRFLGKRLVEEDALRSYARRLYIALVERARNPFFYTLAGVEDSLDGRFEVLVLHLYQVLSRLRESQPEFCQHLSEVFFEDMDRNLREMGVSDTGVPKRMRQMSEALYGRIHAYDEAFLGTRSLEEALRRNVYGKTEPVPNALKALCDDVLKVRARLSDPEVGDALLKGEFPAIAVPS